MLGYRSYIHNIIEEPLGSGSGNAGEDPQVVSRDGRIIAADSSPGLTGPSQRLMEDCSEREMYVR